MAVLFWAFAAGGPALAGFVAVVQLVPAALLAPVGGMIGDRLPRDRALCLIYALQALAMGVVAVALIGGNRWLVVPAAVAATVFIGWSRPSHYAAAAELSATPAEAAAANSLSGTLEGTGYFVGPVLAGLGASLGDPALVVGACALVAASGAFAVRGLGYRQPAIEPEGSPGVIPATAPEVEAEPACESDTGDEPMAGIGALRNHPAALALLLLVGVEFLVEGSLELLSIAYAHDHLDRGSSAAGLLIGSIGAGATVGATLTVVLVGWRRLSPAVAGGLLLAGFPLVAMPFLHALPPAVAIGCIAGVGQAFFAVAGITLLQRSVADAVMARVLALRESALLGGLAVGAAIVPFLVRIFGSGGAYAVLGISISALAVAAIPLLVRLDAHANVRPEVVELLRGVPFLSVLDARALERLAQRSREIVVPAGTAVVREGEPGDLYYLIADGALEVDVSGRPERVRLGPGDAFGEIALLRNVPRTATVTTVERSRLWAVERAAFLETVAGSAGAELAAARQVDQMIGPSPAPDHETDDELD